MADNGMAGNTSANSLDSRRGGSSTTDGPTGSLEIAIPYFRPGGFPAR